MKIKILFHSIKDKSLIYNESKKIELDPFIVEECEVTHVESLTKEYSDKVLEDVLSTINGYTQKSYQGQLERLAREVYEVVINELIYKIAFVFDRDDKYTQLQIELEVKDQQESFDKKYNKPLETIKISMKNRLLNDWTSCTWIYDEQSELLCSTLYPQIFRIENRVREFANRVLIRHLGYNWIEHCGMEKYKESSDAMGEAFKQSVPEFRDINTTMLSVTLETLVKLLYEGKIYERNLKIQYDEIHTLLKIAKNSNETNMLNFLDKHKDIRENIWDGIVSKYLNDPDAFQEQFTQFIKDRNHVAHNKLLTYSAYNIMLGELEKFDDSVKKAIEKFEIDNPSEEVMETLDLIREQQEIQESYEDYWREQINEEAGVKIRDEDEIFEMFVETVGALKEDISDRYHLDECFEYNSENDLIDYSQTLVANVQCNAVNDEQLDIYVAAFIDESMGGNSTLEIIAKHGDQLVAEAKCIYSNGSAHETSEGVYIGDGDSDYLTDELTYFKNEIFRYIEEDLNPLIKRVEIMNAEYIKDGGEKPVADFPCEFCGKFGVSIMEELLPIGTCCYCGNENTVHVCELCGSVYDEFDGDESLCNNCKPKEE